MSHSFKPLVEKDPNINLIRMRPDDTIDEEYDIESSIEFDNQL